MLPIIDEIKSELYFILKHEVEQTFGKRITTSRDCLDLADEIYQRTSFKISSNTLRRFFSLVKSEYPPSVSTVNILTIYGGFNSFEELAASRKTLREGSFSKEGASFLNYLITLFTYTPVKNINDETFTSFVVLTIKYLNSNPVLIENFQRAIARTKSGVEYYFEKLADIDKLNSFYGSGLRYYISETKMPEKKIFGYSMLCLRDWLVSDDSTLKINFDSIRRFSLPKTAPQFIQGRYFAAHLLYANNFGVNAENILVEAYKAHVSFQPVCETVNISQSFEYVFSEALVLTGHFEQALYYINYLVSGYPETSDIKEQSSRQKLLLLKAIALSKTERVSEAETIYQSIDLSKFCFITKKLNTMLFIVLSNCIKKNSPAMDKQMTDLVAESGFTKLNSLM